MDEVVVSVICTTYNHERYIAETIESFIMQKTEFRYEILIHDDASTDNTAEIIKKYEKKFPEIIKPVYQRVNQYSQGVNVHELTRQRARGKYFALCEGDDCWIDPYKLQKQINFLEKNPQYSLSVHETLIVDANTGKKVSSVKPSKYSRTFSVEEVIYGGGDLFATNSMVYRKPKGNIMPQFFYDAPVGDYPLAIYLALNGRVHYINECMSIYRKGVKGSWSQREFNNLEKRNQHSKKIEIMLNDINKYSGYKYAEIINRTIVKNEFYLAVELGNYNKIKEGKLREFYNNLSIVDKVKLLSRIKLPIFYRYLHKFKNMIS